MYIEIMSKTCTWVRLKIILRLTKYVNENSKRNTTIACVVLGTITNNGFGGNENWTAIQYICWH